MPFGAEDQRRRQRQIDGVVALRRIPREANRPDAELFQLLDRARDVHLGRDRHVRHGARRRFRGDAVERRRMPRLPHDAVRTRRIDGPQDGADVVRILDAVEHDEQRRRGRAPLDDLARL